MSKQYDVAIVFGRFQPLHNQHIELFKQAMSVANHVIIMVGSADRPRTPKNPMTYQERRTIIADWLTYGAFINDVQLSIAPVRDYIYSNQTWAEEVQRTIDNLTQPPHEPNRRVDLKVAVIGCLKDESSFYLKMFPQWELVEMPYSDKVDATQIRDIMFSGKSLSFLDGVLPPVSTKFVREFIETPVFEQLSEERDMIAKYKKAWAAAPYAPTFVTADAVVIQSGHILLVRRKAAPGRGLLALPGGFLDQNETVEQAVIRELREETKIKVPAPVLQGSIREMKVFDAPGRSSRGRTITHAGLIVLEGEKLPKVKGSDDAEHAGWYALGSLNSEDFFEDHFDIIQYFKGRV